MAEVIVEDVHKRFGELEVLKGCRFAWRPARSWR